MLDFLRLSKFYFELRVIFNSFMLVYLVALTQLYSYVYTEHFDFIVPPCLKALPVILTLPFLWLLLTITVSDIYRLAKQYRETIANHKPLLPSYKLSECLRDTLKNQREAIFYRIGRTDRRFVFSSIDTFIENHNHNLNIARSRYEAMLRFATKYSADSTCVSSNQPIQEKSKWHSLY